MLPCFVYFFRPFAAMGMETALLQFSFPLLLFSLSKFIMQPTRRWATGFFLSGTLLALSRLDTILLTGPLYCLVFLYMSREKRFSPVQFLLLCALGTLPLFVYLGYNSMEFGSIMPVSGAVKGLRNAPIIISFYSLSTVGEHFLRSKKFLLQALIAVIALVPAIGSMRRKPDSMNAVFIWLLVFPLFFFVTTAMRSDWPIWSWYFYPLPLAATIGVLILFMHRVKALSYTVTTGAILTILLCVTIVEVIKDQRARYQDLILNSGHYLT